MNPSKVQLYTTSEYFEELIHLVVNAKPGGRLVLATMSFDPKDRTVFRLMEALYDAASRGVLVRLIVDAHDFMVGRPLTFGPLFWGGKLNKNAQGQFGIKYSALEKLRRYGGEYAVINRPNKRFSLPVAGRSHIKFAIADNSVFIGGCNLNKSGSIDVMIRLEDHSLANKLYALSGTILKAGAIGHALGFENQMFKFAAGELLIDAGTRNSSVILDEAYELIDQAESKLYITCQYFPYGETANHVLAALNRGVDVNIIFNHPSRHDFPRDLLQYMATAYERYRVPAQLMRSETSRKSKFLHAKLLASEKSAIIGSHNYVTAGVRLGTAEIALHLEGVEWLESFKQTIHSQMN